MTFLITPRQKKLKTLGLHVLCYVDLGLEYPERWVVLNHDPAGGLSPEKRWPTTELAQLGKGCWRRKNYYTALDHEGCIGSKSSLLHVPNKTLVVTTERLKLGG